MVRCGDVARCGAGDRHEVRWRGRCRIRLIERGSIGQVERLDLEPEFRSLLDRELAEEPQIHVEESRTTERVQTHIAEASLADRREGGRIVERGAKSDAAELLYVGSDLIRYLLVLRSIQGRTIRRHEERPAAVQRDVGI